MGIGWHDKEQITLVQEKAQPLDLLHRSYTPPLGTDFEHPNNTPPPSSMGNERSGAAPACIKKCSRFLGKLYEIGLFWDNLGPHIFHYHQNCIFGAKAHRNNGACTLVAHCPNNIAPPRRRSRKWYTRHYWGDFTWVVYELSCIGEFGHQGN